MARPLNDPVLQAVTDTGASRSVFSRGHRTHTIFVSIDEDRSPNGSLEVRLEVSPNDEDWATATTMAGDQVIVTEDDFNSRGNAMIATFSFAAEHMRAYLQTNTEDEVVDVWLMSSSNSGSAQRGKRAGEP